MPGNPPVVSLPLLTALLAIVGSIIGVWTWVVLRIAFGLPVLPANRPRIVPWGAGSVLVAMVVWYGTTSLVVLGFSMANPQVVALAKANGGMPPPVDLMTLTALYNAASLLTIPLTLMLIARARSRDFGLVGPGLARQMIQGIIAYPILAPFVFGMNLVAVSIWKPKPHPLQEAIQQNLSPGLAVLMIVAGAILAPIAEELVFRGILLGWLTRIALGAGSSARREQGSTSSQDLFNPGTDLVLPHVDSEVRFEPFDDDLHNPYRAPLATLSPTIGHDSDDQPTLIDTRGRWPGLLAANVIVSMIFAALHGQVWPSPIPIFFLSLGLGLLYQRTGGLVASIALHMTFNATSTLIMFLSIGLNPQGAPKAPAPVPEPAAVVGIVEVIEQNEFLRIKPLDAVLAG